MLDVKPVLHTFHMNKGNEEPEPVIVHELAFLARVYVEHARTMAESDMLSVGVDIANPEKVLSSTLHVPISVCFCEHCKLYVQIVSHRIAYTEAQTEGQRMTAIDLASTMGEVMRRATENDMLFVMDPSAPDGMRPAGSDSDE